MPSTCEPGIDQGTPFFDRSCEAEARSTLVPMPYLLFSITKIVGNFNSAARLKLSNTCPWFDAPSPKYVTHTRSLPRYQLENPSPFPNDTWAPTMPCPPKKFFCLLNMCIEPPLPCE